MKPEQAAALGGPKKEEGSVTDALYNEVKRRNSMIQSMLIRSLQAATVDGMTDGEVVNLIEAAALLGWIPEDVADRMLAVVRSET